MATPKTSISVRKLAQLILLAGLICGLPLEAQVRIQRSQTLSCEKGDTLQGTCCCYKPTHTYQFEPVQVSNLTVTFDTGGGRRCESQVTIQVLTRGGWQTATTVDAISSAGNSEMHRLSRRFEVNGAIAGVLIDDRGRCNIDYSEITIDSVPDSPPQLDYDARSTRLPSGSYKVQVITDRTVDSVWHLERSGSRLTGQSEWGCCPPRRIDPLTGTIDSGRVSIARDCETQGILCQEIYEGTIVGDNVEGSFKRNGRYAGRWSLELGTPDQPPPPDKPIPDRPIPDRPIPDAGAVEIVAEGKPPYRVGDTIILRQSPRPLRGARWFLDGKPVSEADTLRWRGKEAGNYRVSLRSRNDRVLASLKIEIDQVGVYRLAGKQMRAKPELQSDRSRGVRNENRELVLTESARVFKVDGNAKRYCVWTMTREHELGRRVSCGSEADPMEGAILVPGRYVIFPSLSDHQSYTEVTLFLRRR